MSGHAGDATASPLFQEPPTDLDPRGQRYYLIERRCKDLCLYLDVLTRNMPRYEKYILSAKMREIGYLCLELAIAMAALQQGLQWGCLALAVKENNPFPSE